MDIYFLLKAAVLGVVEGLTEFLPVSSTGHLIIASNAMNFTGDAANTFNVAIQAGAIVAVCWHYRRRLLSLLLRCLTTEKKLAVNLILAFLPAAIVGLVLNDIINDYFFNVPTVSLTLIAGGLFIFWIEKRQKTQKKFIASEMDDITPALAFKIGCMQCFALIPGTSRSGATIMGAMFLGVRRKAATEFSFFLAIPTILGASAYSLWNSLGEAENILSNASMLEGLGIGFLTSFISALFVVSWLLKYVSTNSFNVFGWYRIIFGIFLSALSFFPE